jgi:signal transduction histidine kinase
MAGEEFKQAFEEGWNTGLQIAHNCTEQVMGVSMEQAMDGLGNPNPELLQNLGISAKDVATLNGISSETQAQIQARIATGAVTPSFTPEGFGESLRAATEGLLNEEQSAALERITPIMVEKMKEMETCVDEGLEVAFDELDNGPAHTPAAPAQEGGVVRQ